MSTTKRAKRWVLVNGVMLLWGVYLLVQPFRYTPLFILGFVLNTINLVLWTYVAVRDARRNRR